MSGVARKRALVLDFCPAVHVLPVQRPLFSRSLLPFGCHCENRCDELLFFVLLSFIFVCVDWTAAVDGI